MKIISMATIQKLFTDLQSENTKVKYAALKALKTLSEKQPALLSAHMASVAKLLDHPNNIFKWNALDILANLAHVDAERRLDPFFKPYSALLKSGELVTAGHVVDNAWKIVLAKPYLSKKITDELLTVPTVPLPTPECRNILIGKSVESFSRCFTVLDSADKKRVVAYVEQHKHNSRPATKKKVEKFLKKYR